MLEFWYSLPKKSFEKIKIKETNQKSTFWKKKWKVKALMLRFSEPPKPESRQRSSPMKESPRSGSGSAQQQQHQQQQQQQHHEKEKERNDRADRDRNDRADKDRQDREMREARENKPDRADRQDRPDRDRDRRSPAHPQQAAHHLQADVVSTSQYKIQKWPRNHRTRI